MIKATAYTNPETIVINSLRDLAATTTEDGWKVVLRFRDENEMKALQAALNYRFPENMKAIEEMPTEDGYYLTQTGTLLYRDGAVDWSVRRPTLDDGKYSFSHFMSDFDDDTLWIFSEMRFIVYLYLRIFSDGNPCTLYDIRSQNGIGSWCNTQIAFATATIEYTRHYTYVTAELFFIFKPAQVATFGKDGSSQKTTDSWNAGQ